MDEKKRNIEGEDIVDVIIMLRELHLHMIMMKQYEIDLVNNLIQKFKLYGNQMKVTERQFDNLLNITEKLHIKIMR